MKLQCIRLDPDCGDVLDSLETVDISRGGLGATCSRPFYPGQRIVMCMPGSTDQKRRSIYATIVRCNQHQEGYHLGLEFDHSAVGEVYSQRRQTVAA